MMGEMRCVRERIESCTRTGYPKALAVFEETRLWLGVVGGRCDTLIELEGAVSQLCRAWRCKLTAVGNPLPAMGRNLSQLAASFAPGVAVADLCLGDPRAERFVRLPWLPFPSS